MTCLDCKEYDYVRSFFPAKVIDGSFFLAICLLIEDKNNYVLTLSKCCGYSCERCDVVEIPPVLRETC